MSELVYFSNAPEVFQAAEKLFAAIKPRISAALPNAEVCHVGSTAIYGSLTKGDLDVLVRVDQADFQEADRVLAEMFIRNYGSDRTESFSAFMDSSASPELGVQLVAAGTEYDNFVDWVNKLESDDKLQASYDALKAQYHGKSNNDYRAAKAKFISKNMRD